MCDFKVGDRVRRVEPNFLGEYCFGVKGCEYTVLSVGYYGIQIFEGKPSADPSCFELVSKGDRKGYAKWINDKEKVT